jgi:hypothetical protein
MVVLRMSNHELIVWLIGLAFGGFLGFLVGLTQNKDSLPPCPGNVISAEYYKDGVMFCRYQVEPTGMKTYKQQVK